MDLKAKIAREKLPEHIAIIMDGNGRWAKKLGKFRIFGHERGVNAVREATEGCAELGIKHLTLYAFSTENWNRPKLEITALMELLVRTIHNETPTLKKNNIKLNAIGQLDKLPERCYRELQEAMEATANNTGLTLHLALSYSARWDIINATQKIAEKVKLGQLQPEEINESIINRHLSTHNIPHPELLIRTSGEHRVSNFLLWEIAYAEFYFTEVLWPDFNKEGLYEAILNYQQRERRFGKTSEQLVS